MEDTMKDFQRFLEFHKELLEAELKVVNRYIKGDKPQNEKGTSNMDLVENVLRTAGRPLHISEILDLVYKTFSVQLERDSVVSNLVKKIKAKKTFKRTAPNTFALIE
jgi:hypothetical protein